MCDRDIATSISVKQLSMLLERMSRPCAKPFRPLIKIPAHVQNLTQRQFLAGPNFTFCMYNCQDDWQNHPPQTLQLLHCSSIHCKLIASNHAALTTMHAGEMSTSPAAAAQFL